MIGISAGTEELAINRHVAVGTTIVCAAVWR
jgi:hypothetical protein